MGEYSLQESGAVAGADRREVLGLVTEGYLVPIEHSGKMWQAIPPLPQHVLSAEVSVHDCFGEMGKGVESCEFSLGPQAAVVGHELEQLRAYALGELAPPALRGLRELCSYRLVGAGAGQSRQQRGVLPRHRFGHPVIVECVVFKRFPGNPAQQQEWCRVNAIRTALQERLRYAESEVEACECAQ
ncbi:hypothetical protein AWC21_24780 [Mycolicibacterium peregrinum]|nr:hypothetical protein AWC21_24780 [Mycolicibacterium peregrinum]